MDYNSPNHTRTNIWRFKGVKLMYIILKKASISKIEDVINESFKKNNKELVEKIKESETNNLELVQRVEELNNNMIKSLKIIEDLKRDNNKNKRDILYLETLLKGIHENIVNDNKICPICNFELPAFVPFGNPPRENAMCPKCGSLERDRASYLFLKEKTKIFEEPVKLLHFAPEKNMAKIFSNKINIDYLPVDINPKMEYVKEKMDIQAIKYPENTFDFIYCSHVLEHIPDDLKALDEIYRVLKNEGTALIIVPINPEFKVTLERSSNKHTGFET